MFLIERYEQSHLFNTLQIQEKREASVFVIMRRSLLCYAILWSFKLWINYSNGFCKEIWDYLSLLYSRWSNIIRMYDLYQKFFVFSKIVD